MGVDRSGWDGGWPGRQGRCLCSAGTPPLLGGASWNADRVRDDLALRSLLASWGGPEDRNHHVGLVVEAIIG